MQKKEGTYLIWAKKLSMDRESKSSNCWAWLAYLGCEVHYRKCLWYAFFAYIRVVVLRLEHVLRFFCLCKGWCV